jgi:hypothetical protein
VFENPYTEPPKVDGNTALTLIFVVCQVVHNLQSTWIPILRLMFWLNFYYWFVFILARSEDRSTGVPKVDWLKCLI